jgi:mRNA-degrading endonuclease HigB of HigAB toxin-antitoxin module
MTEPTYEVNNERLQSLSIADLTSIYNHIRKYEYDYPEDLYKVFGAELDKRINDIIIF